jgi:tRNA (guanine-N7-)-methyltransferase
MTRSQPTLDVSSTLLVPESFTPEGTMDWHQLFGNDGPVELEIGSGKGLFLLNAASERPGHNFLGVELSRKYARLAAERIVKRGLGNIRVWPGDAGNFMARRVADTCLRAVHVYFPDPWWKKRHKKRRVFNERLVRAIARTLEPEGELHIATDVEEYFHVMNELIQAVPGFVPLPSPEERPPEHDLDYLTNFERKFRREGRPIYRSAHRKAAAVKGP